jgi:threonine dehydrogenase-like Zn-dependent dehydrogenase
MAETGRLVVMRGNEIAIREYPVVGPATGAMLVRQELSGICGTDVHNWKPRRMQDWTPLGPENVGVIEAIGEGVTHDHHGRPLAPGDRVVWVPGSARGPFGGRPLDEPPHFRAGFGDYVHLWQEERCIIKTALPAEVAVLAEPFTIAVHGVSRSGLQFGDTVVIQGSGPIGLMTLVAARGRGAGRLIVVGGPAGRLAMARDLGADITIDIAETTDAAERTRMVLESTPRGAGADIVFECAGVLPAITEGLGYVRQSGTFVAMGHFVDVGSLELNPNQLLMRKNLRLEAIWAGGDEVNFVRAVTVLERAEYPLGQLVTPLPLERVVDGFETLSGGYRLDGRDVVKIALRGCAG